VKLHNVVYVSATLVAAVTMMGHATSQPAKIERFDASLDAVIAPGATLEKVADGYTWTEGPVWIKNGGYLLFADIPANAIWQFTPGAGTKMFMHPSGWAEKTPFGGKEPGSNGMTLDAHGRLTVAGHANRNVWRLETLDPHGPKTILADRFEGKRFNSPNDLVYSKDGSLYFTDPPYGLATQEDTDPKKELKVNGVYRLPGALQHAPGAPPANDKLQLLISDITRPNGIAFSPDEKFLYVDCSDLAKKTWLKYPMNPNGSLGKAILLADVTADPRIGGPDGIKVDRAGNLLGTGPGGIWIFSPQGKHIGTLDLPERSGNLAWGGPDAKTLYITASTSLYRIQLKTGGLLP
jgi:gluconolactonase